MFLYITFTEIGKQNSTAEITQPVKTRFIGP